MVTILWSRPDILNFLLKSIKFISECELVSFQNPSNCCLVFVCNVTWSSLSLTSAVELSNVQKGLSSTVNKKLETEDNVAIIHTIIQLHKAYFLLIFRYFIGCIVQNTRSNVMATILKMATIPHTRDPIMSHEARILKIISEFVLLFDI